MRIRQEWRSKYRLFHIVIDVRLGLLTRASTLIYDRPTNQLPSDIPENDRVNAALYTDPVHTIKLAEFVKHHLGNVVAQCGGEERFREQWLVNVDKDVVKAFGEAGIM